MNKFQTNYELFEVEPVKMDDELITEQTGYRTTKEIVEGMVMAGERLSDYRHGELDNFDEEYDEKQEPAQVYENDPVELENAVQRNVMRYRGKKKEVSDAQTDKVLEKDGKTDEKVGKADAEKPDVPVQE
jgi:hypothetical protein